MDTDLFKKFFDYLKTVSTPKKVVFVLAVLAGLTFALMSCTGFKRISYDRDADGNVHFHKVDSISAHK
ncbi:hypothetical protein [Sigmofec virus UA08Rod_4124]|uniref:Uncharacterized protein n=1 Tax=Sigmofec virus UA08Rod_4124 TaxID=2929395 RepID=A0A976R835_9VIRU|nr:hypothetical protein [Sigmofec virus UA08Rod_4124]